MFIFWKGRGLLIGLFAILGFGVGEALKGDGTTGFGLGPWLAAAATWAFALTLGKSTKEILLDPATNQLVALKREHTLYFLPPFVWAIGLTGVALILSFADPNDLHRRSSRVGSTNSSFADATFKSADITIGSTVNDGANGNTKDAATLAKAFSDACGEARNLMIEKGASEKLGLTDDRFSTYVHLTPTRCIFLVHVPALRKFSHEAKDTMAGICWRTAQALADRLVPKPKTVALGIRGELLYDRAYRGHIVTQVNEVADGIELREDGPLSHKLLIPLFAAESSTANNGKSPRPQTASAVVPTANKTLSVDNKATATPLAPVPPSVSATSLPTEVRDWKSADGRPLRAALTRFIEDSKTTAEFRREDGQTFQVPVDRFSSEDKEFIRALPAH